MIPAIEVENLGKKYIIGHQKEGMKYTALRDVMAETARKWTKRIINSGRKEGITDPTREEFWALNNLTFDVKQGEKLGIIGKNGAGKSTVLKILSRITEPTTGRIKIKGRVACLLEVGTGFHPELTGRENIYLNGAILGMGRMEIKKKFDQIVSFAEIEKFLDTPVKRYSSGMYVRLAFAVAAHLEPEILLVDEVLAVGDASFQKKCLGKMGEIGKEGRTVLFISHNMQAISALCDKVIVLKRGKIEFNGDVEEGISRYFETGINQKVDFSSKNIHTGPCRYSKIYDIQLLNSDGIECYDTFIGSKLTIKLFIELSEDVRNLEIGFSFQSMLGTVLSAFLSEWEGLPKSFSKGRHIIICEVNELMLFPGIYGITPWLKRSDDGVDEQIPMALTFSVMGTDITGFNPNLTKYPNMGVFHRARWSVQI